MNARMCELTFGRTNMHADRQTDGRTDGLKHTPSRTRACKHTNACIDERKLVRSNIWTHEHAFGQTNRQTDRRTDGRTDGLTHTPSRTRACTHTNACIDECRLVRSNIWTHEHVRGQTDRQTDGLMDGRMDSHLRNHARAHAHTRTVACLHAHTMHSGTYAQTDRHTHTCSYGGKHPSTNMEVRS